jgi:hypothetical protein
LNRRLYGFANRSIGPLWHVSTNEILIMNDTFKIVNKRRETNMFRSLNLLVTFGLLLGFSSHLMGSEISDLTIKEAKIKKSKKSKIESDSKTESQIDATTNSLDIKKLNIENETPTKEGEVEIIED